MIRELVEESLEVTEKFLVAFMVCIMPLFLLNRQ